MNLVAAEANKEAGEQMALGDTGGNVQTAIHSHCTMTQTAEPCFDLIFLCLLSGECYWRSELPEGLIWEMHISSTSICGCSSVCTSRAGNALWKGSGPADAQQLLRKMAPYCPSWSVLLTSGVCPSLTAQEMRRNLDPEITNQKGKNAPIMQRKVFPWPP